MKAQMDELCIFAKDIAKVTKNKIDQCHLVHIRYHTNIILLLVFTNIIFFISTFILYQKVNVIENNTNKLLHKDIYIKNLKIKGAKNG